MKFIQTSLVVLVCALFAATSAHAAIDTTALVAGLGELQTIAALIVTGLITFAVTWFVGKKAYGMLRGS